MFNFSFRVSSVDDVPLYFCNSFDDALCFILAEHVIGFIDIFCNGSCFASTDVIRFYDIDDCVFSDILVNNDEED